MNIYESSGYLISDKRSIQYEPTALETNSTLPTDTSLSVTVRQDTDDDGTAENEETVTLDGGSESHGLSNFGVGGSVWIHADLDTADTTVRPSIDRAEIIFPTPPAEPTNVSATVDADDQITLSWDRDTSGDTNDHYEVEILRDGGSWVNPAGGPTTISDDGSSSYTATYGPHNSGGSAKNYAGSVGIDSSFQFRVRAVGPDDEVSNWTSSGTVHTTPIPPYNPSVSRPNANTIEISWTVRSDIVEAYEIYAREDTGSGYGQWDRLDSPWPGDSNVSEDPSQKGNTPTVTYEVGTTYDGGWELQSNARYQFRLLSYSNGERSNWVFADYGNSGNVYFEDDFSSGDASAWDSTSGSASVTGTLTSYFTAGDNTRTPEVGGYAVEMGGPGYVQKSLGDLSGESDVHVRVRVQAASNDTASETGDIWWYDGSTWHGIQQWGWEHDGQGWMEYHATVPDSYLSTDNRVRVGRGEGGGGDYIAFDEVIVADLLHEYTQPVPPSNLTLETTAEGELSYSFTDNMAIQEASRPFGDLYLDGERVSKHGSTSSTFSGLKDGEEYTVRTRNSPTQFRRGERETWWDVSGPSDTAITVLPAPTGIAVGTITADTAAISWTDNHDYGDTRVEYKQTDDGSWTTISTLSRNTEAETLTDLLNGEEYDVRVVAQTEHTATEDQ